MSGLATSLRDSAVINLGNAVTMVVDDSPFALKLTTQTLLGFGIRTRHACHTAADAKVILANNPIDLQEFMVMPLGFDRFSDALRCGTEIFHNLKKVLADKGMSTAVGDEGGFAPNLTNSEEALQVIMTAIENSGYRPGDQVKIALDCACTEMFDAKTKTYKIEGKTLDQGQLVEMLAGWADRYPICSIEDGCSEDDWEGWKMLTDRLG